MFEVTLYLPAQRHYVVGKADEKLIIGRGPAEEDLSKTPLLDLSPYGAYEGGVSRRHLMLIQHGNRVLAFDLDSHNGSRVNDKLLSAHQANELAEGDVLQLGSLTLHVRMVVLSEAGVTVPHSGLQIDSRTALPGFHVPQPDIRSTLATQRFSPYHPV